MLKIPVIDITDLYIPLQDAADNFDLVLPYALSEIDLRAVILDTTEKMRQPVAHHLGFEDSNGPRDPGFIAVMQLNYIFGRNVPCATSPFTPLRSPDDAMRDVPAFQQQGIELILETLRRSEQPVAIMTQGSLRALAAAYNREPDLLRAKVERIHISAGASSPTFLEWNVSLDPHAFVRLLRSDLPIALYPCATEEGPFGYGRHNSFWQMTDMRFIAHMHPRLRRYLGYAFGRLTRVDFLRALDDDLPAGLMERIYTLSDPGHPDGRHYVWETALWTNITNRRLVRRQNGEYRLIPSNELLSTDSVLPNNLRPCHLDVRDDGLFTFAFNDAPSTIALYDRQDPLENERAFRQALTTLYTSFAPE
jgi:pyrimidine-specific ribonucleoside hydrolase